MTDLGLIKTWKANKLIIVTLKQTSFYFFYCYLTKKEMNKTKTLVLLFLMASSLASRGQDTIQPRYQSVFGDSCATWYIYCMDGLEGIGTDIRKYTHNDTIKIEETTYNILRRTGSISMFSHYGNIHQYMRESRDHSKLYFKGQGYPEDDFPEVLIMDLDMNIGDTMDTQGWLEYSYYPNEYNSPTIIIDTVYYNEGRKILRTN